MAGQPSSHEVVIGGKFPESSHYEWNSIRLTLDYMVCFAYPVSASYYHNCD